MIAPGHKIRYDHLMKFRPRRRPKQAHRTGWEHVSGWYSEYLKQPGTLQSEVIFPGALRLLNPKDGGRYLDLACGEGSFTRLLSKHHRVRLVGLDAAPSLIRQAKAKAPKDAEYFVGDATDFARVLPVHEFDGMTCILAIQNIDPIDPVFRDAAGVLKPGAAFVIVMNHPCFRQPRQSGWGWDETRKLQYRRVDKYLASYEVPIAAHPGSAPEIKTFSYHRPLSAYAAALARHGFTIDALKEWTSPKISDSGPKARAENAARQEIPLFLALKAVKR